MSGTGLVGCTILIIEDEPLIALDIVEACEKAGAKTMMAQNYNQAERLVETDDLSAAVVDFRLWNENANRICDRLKERGIPFVVHSAYTKFYEGNEAVNEAVLLPKPATSHGLVETLRALIAAAPKKTPA